MGTAEIALCANKLRSVVDGVNGEGVSSESGSAVWIGDGIGERDFTIEVVSWCVGPTVGVITGNGTIRNSEVVDIELAELGFRI